MDGVRGAGVARSFQNLRILTRGGSATCASPCATCASTRRKRFPAEVGNFCTLRKCEKRFSGRRRASARAKKDSWAETRRKSARAGKVPGQGNIRSARNLRTSEVQKICARRKRFSAPASRRPRAEKVNPDRVLKLAQTRRNSARLRKFQCPARKFPALPPPCLCLCTPLPWVSGPKRM